MYFTAMKNFHLCLEHFQCSTDEMKARSPENFMDVNDEKVTDEDGFSVLQHDDQSKEHHHEGAKLDQSCRSARSCFQYLADRQATVSRLASTDQLAGMDMLCSDKTCTLTQNIMTIESKLPWCETLEQGLLLLFALLATEWFSAR